MELLLTERLATLSHPQRMAVFRLLVRRCPDELPAGEIVSALGLRPSTASVYLSALTQAGLIMQRRVGTRLLYAVNLNAAQDVITGLFVDCCRGRADLCPPAFTGLTNAMTPTLDRKYNILFLCSGNSARSIMAEAILRDLAGDTFNAYSAGTSHRSKLHPLAVAMLQSKGHDVSHLRSKNMIEFQQAGAPQMDFVFTLCDRAANEDCPTWPGQPFSSHWGLPAPGKTQGSRAEKQLSFQQTYDALYRRINALLVLPVDQPDRRSMQKSIDEIGKEFAQQDV